MWSWLYVKERLLRGHILQLYCYVQNPFLYETRFVQWFLYETRFVQGLWTKLVWYKYFCPKPVSYRDFVRNPFRTTLYCTKLLLVLQIFLLHSKIIYWRSWPSCGNSSCIFGPLCGMRNDWCCISDDTNSEWFLDQYQKRNVNRLNHEIIKEYSMFAENRSWPITDRAQRIRLVRDIFHVGD